MKKVGVMVAAGMLVSFFVCSNAALAGPISDRQVNQQQRIWQGVVSGEVTGREAAVLEREQCRIQKSKQQAWSDGVLTPREGARLHYQQDWASGHIYKLKHNDTSR